MTNALDLFNQAAAIRSVEGADALPPVATARASSRKNPKERLAEVLPMNRRIPLKGAADIARPLPPVEYVIRHFGVTKGRPTLLAGYGGVGKTILVQALALHMAAGLSSCWGLDVKPGAVVHLDYEMSEEPVFRRYQRLANAFGIGLDACALQVGSLPPVYLSDDDAVLALADICLGKTLCIIDNLAAATGTADVKENDSGVRRYLDKLGRVSAATGCCFIVLAHERKGSKDDTGGGLQRVRGNSSIIDACGSVVSVAPADAPGVLKLSQSKASHRKGGDEVFLQVADVGEADGDDDSPGLIVRRLDEEALDKVRDGLESRILALLAKGSQKNRTSIETALAVKKKGSTSTAVNRLLDAGEIVETFGSGKGGFALASDGPEDTGRSFEAVRADVLLKISQGGAYAGAEALCRVTKATKPDVTAALADLEQAGDIVRLTGRWVPDSEALRRDRVRDAVRSNPEAGKAKLLALASVTSGYFDRLVGLNHLRVFSADSSGYVWSESG